MTTSARAVLIFAELFVSSAALGSPGLISRIEPIRATLTYSNDAASDVRTMELRSASGSVLYHLSIQPDRDVENRTIVLNVVLQSVGNSGELPNLLDPTGKLFGYQPYTLAASDFASGIDRSAYGRRRRFSLPKIGICVNLDILSAQILPLTVGAKSGRGYQFERLTLTAGVANLVVYKGLASCQIKR